MSNAEQDVLFDLLANQRSTLSEIQRLVNLGENISRTRMGNEGDVESTAFVAAAHPNPDILKFVLQAGADPNFKSKQGYTPYFKATSLAHLQILVDHGARYPEPTRWNETPLKESYRTADLPAIEFHLSNGAQISELKISPIHIALLFGDESLMNTTQSNIRGLETTDALHRTPLMLAFQLARLDAVDTLVANGASLNAVDHIGQNCLHFAAMSGSVKSVIKSEEYGLDIESKDNFHHTALKIAAEFQCFEVIDYLIERLKSRTNYFRIVDKASCHASDSFSFQKFIDAGAKLDSFDSETRLEMNPAKHHDFDLTKIKKSEFERAMTARFGSANPDEISEPFWQAMIVNRFDAYSARQHFNYNLIFRGASPPVWCADRFGQSLTLLPDGRIIEIAGEHEDGYDPDFCIYNDVFVHEPGNLPRIFLYPREVFPPTDFHTATLMGDWIYIIGSLGYQEDRTLNLCPVFRLNIYSLHIERVETKGNDPGRIYKHRAIKLSESEILVRDGGLCAISQQFDAPHVPSIFNINDNSWNIAIAEE